MKRIVLFLCVAALCSMSATAQTVSPCGFAAPKAEFKEGSCTLTADTKSALEQLATDMKANPDCRITLQLKGKSKAMQQVAGCRGDAIQKYLGMKGVDEGRVKIVIDKKADSDIAEIEVNGD